MSLKQWLKFYRYPINGVKDVMKNHLMRQVIKFANILSKIDKKWFTYGLVVMFSWMGFMLRISKSFRRWTLKAAKLVTFVFSLLGILISAVLLGLKHEKFEKKIKKN